MAKVNSGGFRGGAGGARHWLIFANPSVLVKNRITEKKTFRTFLQRMKGGTPSLNSTRIASSRNFSPTLVKIKEYLIKKPNIRVKIWIELLSCYYLCAKILGKKFGFKVSILNARVKN